MKIEIDNLKVNPYDILGVNENDTMEKIEKEYKKRALLLHPDKSKLKKELSNRMFKVLNKCFEYIKQKKINKLNELENNEIYGGINKFDNFTSPNNSKSQNFYNINKIETFNEKFENHKIEREKELNLSNFNKYERLQNIEDYTEINVNNYGLDVKNFNVDDFNAKFNEISKTNNEQLFNSNKQLIHETTDGFMGANSGGEILKNVGYTNYHDGVLLVRDEMDDYNTTFYGDYRNSFQPLHPTISQSTVSQEIESKNYKKMLDNKIKERNNISMPCFGSKTEFVIANKKFEKNAEEKRKKYELESKKVIEKYLTPAEIYRIKNFDTPKNLKEN
jgi:curved DNA-binding protein CbpA